MSASIRFLLLNNLSTHRDEIFMRFGQAGFVPNGYSVVDKTDFLKKLAEYEPTMILVGMWQDGADNQFSFEQVHRLMSDEGQKVPVWMIVEPQHEAMAVAAMYKGLDDYFFTDRLNRLVPMAARLVGLESKGVEPVDLNRIVNDYVAGQVKMADSSGVGLTFLPGADLPRVSGEADALAQALGSILGEVVRTAPAGMRNDVRTYLDALKGEVCLEMKLTEEGENEVAESAVISEDSLDIGSARKVLETYNGRIDIDQGDEADLRVCVYLPAILEKEVKGTPNLLVVENSVLMRSILKEALEQEGFKVKVAENGDAALGIMVDFQPDLIISDVAMPVMDGFDFFDAVRAQGQWQNIPFIFVTGQSEQKVELNTRALQGATYLIKPIVINELLVAVRSRL